MNYFIRWFKGRQSLVDRLLAEVRENTELYKKMISLNEAQKALLEDNLACLRVIETLRAQITTMENGGLTYTVKELDSMEKILLVDRISILRQQIETLKNSTEEPTIEST